MRLLLVPSATFLAAFLIGSTGTAQCTDPDAFEDNDTCETAAYTLLGGSGLTVQMHDSDWFRVPVPPKGKIVIDILFSHLVANVDARLWDACGGTKISEGNTVTDDEQLIAINYADEPVDFFAEVLVNPASSGNCAPYDIVVHGASENIGANYCQTVPNSSGAPAVMSAMGSLSVALNHVVLLAGPVPPRQPGIFYYGPQRLEIPFANGWRCVGPGTLGTFLLPLSMSSAAGELRSPLDLTDPPAEAGRILRGSTWNFQAWFRDPGAGGSKCNLSDALTLVFQP